MGYGCRGTPWDRTFDLGVLLPQAPSFAAAARIFRARPRLSRRRALVLTAQIGVVGAVVAGTAAFVAFDKTVTVRVDGQSQHVRTFATTVSAVLDRAHVVVGPHDLVVPGESAHVGNHETIVVRRGRPIELTIGQQTQVVWVTATSVHEALEQLGLDQQGAWVSASRSRPIGLAGTSLAVRLPQAVSLVADGREIEAVTTRTTIGDVLADYHLRLGAQDVLSVPSSAYPVDGMVVSITRIASGKQVNTRVVSHTVSKVADATLLQGNTRTVTQGQDGVIRSVYVLTYTNGKLTGRKLASETTVMNMQPTVIAYGTRPVPVYQPTYRAAGGGGLDWAALASCESGGNPGSVSGGGTYRGLYQFTLGTWQGVGGSGDPINASASEQTYRAQLLYARSGRGAWPICGQYL
jgi:uncharacterized protein YabE (DUF348 family)